jgi:predicted homoserine dehydrogenase-like protein
MISPERFPTIGISGTGFIATGLFHLLRSVPGWTVSKVLTRRPLASVEGIDPGCLTQSLAELIDGSDIVFECSGDAIHATEVVFAATDAGKRVVTINSEFHVTTGSYFARRGDYVTEADGDQPGCLARLKQELDGMGFKPQAYVNLKGFLNPAPTESEMIYWSEKQGLAIDQVVSFTDGTKLQIEQALVANGLGASLAPGGMIGATVDTLADLDFLVDAAEKVGAPVSDYVLCKGAPPGVLIVASNAEADRLPGYLPFSRLQTTQGKGYLLLRSYHLCHLEALNTLQRVVADEPILLNNSADPKYTVAAVAKQSIRAGSVIRKGAGGFDVRGLAVPLAQHRTAVPICLLRDTVVVRNIEPGQVVCFDDVEMADSRAWALYRSIAEQGALQPCR